MPNNYLLVLYKHIIQVEIKNVGLKVCVWGGEGGGHKYTIVPNQTKVGDTCTPPPPLPPAFYASVILYWNKEGFSFSSIGQDKWKLQR